MRNALILATAAAVGSLATAAPAAASETPYYDHSMQALGSSELGMPPLKRGPRHRVTCEPNIFGEVHPACD